MTLWWPFVTDEDKRDWERTRERERVFAIYFTEIYDITSWNI